MKTEEDLIKELLEYYPWDGKVDLREMPQSLFFDWVKITNHESSYDLLSSIEFFEDWCNKHV